MPVQTTRLKTFKAKDPTRTVMLRRAMLQDMARRFAKVRAAVYKLVAIDDAFGLRNKDLFTANAATLVVNDRWQFLTDKGKVEAFQGWLKTLVDTELLSTGNNEAPWTDKYVASAYKQGLKRGYIESKPHLRRPSNITEGTVAQFLDDSFGSSESIKKLELLGTRAFTNLKGVSAAMDQQLSNVLVQGLAEGKAPGAIAKMMTDQIDGLSRGRAATIARTEIIHAHAEGQLDGFAEAGLNEVIVMAEWATAEDAKVCSRCAPLQGVIFTIEEARGLLPRHPNCRCAWLPAAVGEDTTGQVWGNRQTAILESVKAETGLDDGKAAKAASRWLGADKKLPVTLAEQKPKQSALKEKQALEAFQKKQQSKLNKGQANAAKAAAEKAGKANNIKLGIAKAKLDAAGLPTELTEFTADGVTDALATKIMTTGRGLLVPPEELVGIVAEAKAQPGAARQVGYLLQKRADALNGFKAAAQAQAAADAALAEQAAAKAATQALTGLGEGAFSKGKLTTEAFGDLVDAFGLDPADVKALAGATTATDEAAILAKAIPKAKAKANATLQQYATQWGVDFDMLNKADPTDAFENIHWAANVHHFGQDAAMQDDFIKWAGTQIDELEKAKGAAGYKAAKYEALIQEYKAAQATKAAAERALEVGLLDDAIEVAGGKLTYKEVKANIKGALSNTGQVYTEGFDVAVTQDELLAAVSRAGSEAQAVHVGEVALKQIRTTKMKVDYAELIDAVKGSKWDATSLVVKYKGKHYVLGNEAGVQAAKFAMLPSLPNVYELDLDAWYAKKVAGKAGKAAKWAGNGAKVPYNKISKLYDEWDGPNFAGMPSPLNYNTAFKDDELKLFHKAIADAKVANTKPDTIVAAVADLQRAEGYADKAEVNAALQAAADFPGDGDPWAGVEAWKYKGKLYVKSEVAKAEAASLAKVEQLIVKVWDLDNIVPVPVVAVPTPQATGAATTLLDLVGGPVAPNAVPTLAQAMAKVPTAELFGGKGAMLHPADIFKAIGQEAAWANATPTKRKLLESYLHGMNADWPAQWAVATQYAKNGVVLPQNYVGIADELAKLVNVEKLGGKANKFSIASLKTIAKKLGVTPDEAWITATHGKQNMAMQLSNIKSLAPDHFVAADKFLGKVVPPDAADVKAWAKAHEEFHAPLYKKYGFDPNGPKPDYAAFNKKLQRLVKPGEHEFGLYVSWNNDQPFTYTLAKLDAWAQANPHKLNVQPIGLPASAAQKIVIPKAPTQAAADALPEFGRVRVIKNLPGSTAPQLVEDTANATQWVMKAGLDPGHVRSEALADDLYRRMGFAVPKSGIVDTSGGPVKFSEFLEGGKTLQEHLRTATNAERADVLAQVRRGFVADALLANHDVAGLSMDNLFVHGGKVYRIDNGGALLYRAQGAAKRDFGAAVKELASMRDRATNSVTAELYEGITDVEIHDQIRDIVGKRVQLLEAVPDAKLRKILGERIDWLQAQLPPDTTPEVLRRHLAMTKTPAVYDVDPDAIKRIKRSRVNGVNLSADKDMVEDQNILVWEEEDATGKPVLRASFKVTTKGNTTLTEALPSTKGFASAASTPSSIHSHPEDVYFHNFQAAAKTVTIHAQDKAYNANTLAEFAKTKQYLIDQLGNSPDPSKKAMLEYYANYANEIEGHMQAGTGFTSKTLQYDTTVKVTARKSTQDTYKVTKATHAERVAVIKNGHAKATGSIQEFDMDYTVAYHVEADAGTTFRFVPANGSINGGDAFAGRVSVTLPGGVTPETIQQLRSTMATVGLDIAPATPAAEEALYIHKSINILGKHTSKEYRGIWLDTTMTDEERVKALKSWVKKNMGVDLPDAPNEWYNPAGKALNSYGDGFRVWDRWDLPRAQARTELKDYYLALYTSSGTKQSGALYESLPTAVPDLVEKVLNTGGEMTATMQRLRKGIPIGKVGGSSTEDMKTGGADYVFTRLYKRGEEGRHGLFFKPENAARADAIHYNGDKYGNTKYVQESFRARTVEQMKEASKHTSNEMIFKHGLSLFDDIDKIVVFNDAERTQVIDAYKRAGFAVLPDGRKVEDIVEVY
jgi:SPP1 gp7 family putative phage head morphogenesis protein